ncbi:MAG: FkbM family methyltransferase [Planctomycetes bacterium]|nr:FkbM family methyltransferase [Planctomycetota bacterium]
MARSASASRSPALWPALAWRWILARLLNRHLSRIPLFLPAYRVLRWLLLQAGLPVFTHAGPMVLDRRDTLRLLVTGHYEIERYQTELFEQEVRPGDVVIDIGANIGYYTLLAAGRAGESGEVIAFEPDPRNFAHLKRNVRLNGYRNVTLHKKAVSDRTGAGKLHLSETNWGDHRIFAAGPERPSIGIEIVRLDDLLPAYRGRIRVVKMDIQGGEGLALRGMRELLDGEDRLALMVEFSPEGLRETGVDPTEVLDSLRALGLSISRIDEAERRLVPIDARTFEPPAGGAYLNLLCRRPGGDPP